MINRVLHNAHIMQKSDINEWLYLIKSQIMHIFVF